MFSETKSAAERWIAWRIIFLAFLSASSFASCSDSLIMMARSLLNCSVMSFMIISCASSLLIVEIRSNSSCCFATRASAWFSFSVTLSSFSWIFVSFVSIDCSRFSRISSLRSKFFSRWIILFSWRSTSFRLSFNSFSTSARYLWFSSFASNNTSFFNRSASFSASLIIISADSRAATNFFS